MDSVLGGGAATPVAAVTRVLRNSGADVEVFALERRDGRALPAMLEDGLQVHVREGGEKDHWAAYRWLSRELSIYQPTLIWTSLTRATVIGLLLGKCRAIPVVSWQHIDYLKPIKLKFTHALRKWPVMWVGDSDAITALTAERLDVAPERLACWPLFSANPNAPQAQAWQPGQILRLGSLGRLRPIKAYDVLIDALALLKQRGFKAPVPFEIAIAGEGSEREKITQMAQRIGFSGLNLVGFTNRPHEFLAGLHLYLQPSRGEGLCIGLHEAMQAGLPVIASTVGQMPYTVEAGRNGWLVPPDDVNALANALAEALSNPDKLAAMGQSARQHVLTRYSSEAFSQAGESILERLRLRGVL
ncbi:MAG: glycosyltransferase family 4 protein [Methylotenera sp.]|nr:glycosyltransferase family 4 protein [Methylotenera sp.]